MSAKGQNGSKKHAKSAKKPVFIAFLLCTFMKWCYNVARFIEK